MPTLEASMAAMVENISKIVTTSTSNQTTTESQLDIIMKQLSSQYEQTNTLLISHSCQNNRQTFPLTHLP